MCVRLLPFVVFNVLHANKNLVQKKRGKIGLNAWLERRVFGILLQKKAVGAGGTYHFRLDETSSLLRFCKASSLLFGAPLPQH